MAEVHFIDRSRSGHELGRSVVADAPSRLSLGELLERRIRAEVAVYNADPGPHYVGLVQPEDAIRYSDGHRLRTPRALDGERFVLAFVQAVAAGLVEFRVGELVTAELTTEVDLTDDTLVEVVLARPVVVRES